MAEPTNLPPVAVDDAATTMTTIATLLAVLGNDSDPDGQLVPPPVIVDGPSAGIARVDAASGEVGYVPLPGFVGGDSLAYRIADNDGATDTASLAITVAAPGGIRDGTAVNEVMAGGSGAELLRGFGGIDQIRGSAGNDVLVGGIGADSLSGDAGKDVLVGEAGRDTVFGGAGRGPVRDHRHGQLRPDPRLQAGGGRSDRNSARQRLQDRWQLRHRQARGGPQVNGDLLLQVDSGSGLGTAANLLGVGNLTLDQILANPFDSIWGA